MRVRAFAKVNLCLHVMGKRPDNYHELRTIFQTISLHDTLRLSITPGQPRGAVEIFMQTNDPELPVGPENLVVRAVRAIIPEIGFGGRATYPPLESEQLYNESIARNVS